MKATDTAARFGTTSFTWTTGPAPLVPNPGTQYSTVGVAASLILTASNGTSPYTWTATGLPPGMSINSSTGKVTGTPTVAGSYATTVTATDAGGIPGGISFSWNPAAAVVVASPGRQYGTTGAAGSLTLTATGGSGAYTWSATDLPPGLAINPSTGAVTGTPTAAGMFTVTVSAVDVMGRVGSVSYSDQIYPVAVAAPVLDAGSVSTLTAAGALAGTDQYTRGGIALIGGSAYVVDGTRVMRVDKTTGAVSVLAGATGVTGCQDAATGAAVTFTPDTDGMAISGTDGSYLYVTDTCGLRKIDPSGGATLTITSQIYQYTSIVGQYLYGVAGGGGIWRQDLSSMAPPTMVAGGDGLIAADATSVWLLDGTYGVLHRYDIATGSDTPISGQLAPGMQPAVLVSVGDSLYTALRDAASPYHFRLLTRIDKATGVTHLVGGPGSAGFSGITGIASDGTTLYLADSGADGSSVTTLTATSPNPYPAPPSAPVMDAGSVSTLTPAGALAGTGQYTRGGIAVIGGSAYVIDGTRVMRVDKTTGAVSVLAGATGTTSCQDATTGAAVTFAPDIYGMAISGTDGSYLYVTDTCGLRKIDPAGGATVTVTSQTYPWTSIVGRNLYGIDGGGAIWHQDLSSAAPRTPVVWATGGLIAADATSLWSLDGTHGTLHRYDIATGADTAISGQFPPNLYPYSLISVGDSLYTALVDPLSPNHSRLLARIDKATGVSHLIGGPGSAGISDITGIASDGTKLYLADSAADGNSVKSITPTNPNSYQPAASAPVMDTGAVSTLTAPGALTEAHGVTVVGGAAYTMDGSRLMRVDTTTGAVSVLAGTANSSTWRDDTTGPAVMFGPQPYEDYVVGTDGTYVYVSGLMGIRKVDPVTGSTTTVSTLVYPAATIAGKYLYSDNNGVIYRQDLSSVGASTTIGVSGQVSSLIAADDTSVWLLDGSYGLIHRFDIATGTDTVVAPLPDHLHYPTQLLSVGNYLYVASLSITDLSTVVDRMDKNTGAMELIAGGPTVAHADGTWIDARFGTITGIATDGNKLYIADTDNYATTGSWLRVVRAGKRPTDQGGPSGYRETVGGTNPSNAGPSNACHCDPVQTDTGALFEPATDLATTGRGLPLTMTRTYASDAATTATPVGYGWASSYGMTLTQPPTVPGYVLITQENGSVTTFTQQPDGSLTAASRVQATLTHNPDGTWTFTRRHQDTYIFDTAGRLLSEADRNGNTTHLAYDTTGLLAQVSDPAGRTLTFTYDTAGLIATITAPSGQTVHYTHNPAGDLTTVTDPAGAVTSYGYDANHLMTSIINSRGGTTTNLYDRWGRVVRQTDPAGQATTFDYSADTQIGTITVKVTAPDGTAAVEQYVDGQLRTQTRAAGTVDEVTTSYIYDAVTSQPATVTDPAGHVTSYTYDSAGNQLSETDPLGARQTWTYNTASDMTSAIDPNGITTTYAYDGLGNLLTTATPLLSTGQNRTTVYTHGDPQHPGDVTAITDPDGNTTTSTHASNGDLATVTDARGAVTSYTYDLAGRRTSMTNPRGNRTDYHIGTDGRIAAVTDPAGHTTSFSYDAAGNQITVTDAEGHISRKSYDALGQLTQTTRPDNSTLSYTYDTAGNPTSYTDPAGHTTTSAYNRLGDLTSTTDPLGRVTSYRYDLAGNRTSLTSPDGLITSYHPDIAGHLTSVSYSDGVTPNVSYTYDTAGRRLTMVDGTGTTRYTYDSLNRSTTVTNGAGQRIGYGYDLAGQVTTITYPNGRNVTRGYDRAGNLTSVADWSGNTTSFGYDPDGNLTSENYPNGVVATVTYDTVDQPTAITNTRSGSNLATFAYTRGNNSELTGATSTGINEPNQSYTYDSLGRISGVNNSAYHYNPAGNPTNITGAPTYDNASQLTTSNNGTAISYTYNARGDRTFTTTASSTTANTYDQADRLTTYTPAGGTATHYTYSADGLRASKTTTGTNTYTWDAITDSTPLLLTDTGTTYIYGPGGQPIQQINPDSTTTYLHQDQLGSTRLLTNASGQTSGTYTYDAYGNTTSHTGTANTNLQYTGQYHDNESGLYYLRARYYDTTTGQFLTVDPLNAATHEPYGYTNDDPLNATDPTGRFWGGGTLKRIGNDVWHPTRFFLTAPATAAGLGVAWAAGGDCQADRKNWVFVCYKSTSLPNSDAFTLGSTVNTRLTKEEFSTINCGHLLAHETKHTDQWAIFGAGFLLLYGADALQAWMRSLLFGGPVGNKMLLEQWAGLRDGGYVAP